MRLPNWACNLLSVKQHFVEFCGYTTIAGFSHYGNAPTKAWRAFWGFFLILFTIFTIIHCYTIIDGYFAYRTTITKRVNADKPDFPSVTVCNLNPFKLSLALQEPTLAEQIELYIAAVDNTDPALLNLVRKRRQTPDQDSQATTKYFPIFIDCICQTDNDTGLRRPGACLPLVDGTVYPESLATPEDEARDLKTICGCALSTGGTYPWPCYPKNSWKHNRCLQCTRQGFCPMRFDDESYGPDRNVLGKTTSCMCQEEFNHCVADIRPTIPYFENGVLPKVQHTTADTTTTTTTAKSVVSTKSAVINVFQSNTTFTGKDKITTTTTTPSTTTLDLETVLGYKGMRDELAITATAQENLALSVAALPPERRRRISYQTSEFIHMCTYNGRPCDLDKDFDLHIDPIYGNCFTFQPRSQTAKTARVGSNHGVRMLLYTNISDYLPMSEAKGVRVMTHNKQSHPFPYVYGKNAPTGYQTSFRLKKATIERMGYPYGDCEENEARSDQYIKGSYSREACQRGCLQRYLSTVCRCTDPLAPAIPGVDHCRNTNNEELTCLKTVLKQQYALLKELLSAEGKDDIKCSCKHPCLEHIYQTAGTMARWPSPVSNMEQCDSKDEMCRMRYRQNAAMIEVYYEQLFSEVIRETPIETFVGTLANVGGTLGLWLSASCISLVEIVTLLRKMMFVDTNEKEEEETQFEEPETAADISFNPDLSMPCMCDCCVNEQYVMQNRNNRQIEHDEKLGKE